MITNLQIYKSTTLHCYIFHSPMLSAISSFFHTAPVFENQRCIHIFNAMPAQVVEIAKLSRLEELHITGVSDIRSILKTNRLKILYCTNDIANSSWSRSHEYWSLEEIHMTPSTAIITMETVRYILESCRSLKSLTLQYSPLLSSCIFQEFLKHPRLRNITFINTSNECIPMVMGNSHYTWGVSQDFKSDHPENSEIIEKLVRAKSQDEFCYILRIHGYPNSKYKHLSFDTNYFMYTSIQSLLSDSMKEERG